MKITINGKEYTLKYTIRALILWESITGRMFSLQTLTDQYLFFYCIVMCAMGSESEMTFEDFLKILEDEPQLFADFGAFLENEMKLRGMFPDDGDDSKKKE